MIKDLLTNLDAKEKSRIKSEEISKLDHKGIYKDTTYGVKVEILSLVAIEVNGSHGIEVMAKAWKGVKKLGFGKDGSVEIERFRIFNPPILVQDPNGDILQKWKNEKGQPAERRLREDPLEAVKQTLAHIIKIVGKENTQVINGRVGNTTSTFYPDADPETTSVDGHVAAGSNTTFALTRALPGDTSVDNLTTVFFCHVETNANVNNYGNFYHGIFLFDTSAIPDADTIASATFSVFGTAKTATLGDATQNILHVVASAPASNTALANGDFANRGSTSFGSKANADYSISAYNDFTLNASGLAAITKTGVTKLGGRAGADLDNSEPTWASLKEIGASCYTADQAGTANDPKLIVVHSGAATNAAFLLNFM